MFSKLFGFSDERNFVKWTKDLNFGCRTTQTLKAVSLPTPKQVRIHMDQHEEVSCIPIVEKGDEVKIGQVIAKSNELPTTFIHASVSGKVTKIGDVLSINGIKTKEIIIDVDEIQDIDPNIKPPLIHDQQGFVGALEKSGINELNTTRFLSATKTNENSIDTLLINATLFEPFVVTSIREILENSNDVLNGMTMLMKHLNVKEGIIGIEDNQIESIACLQDILAVESQKYPNISLKTLSSSYPKGSDHLLIQACKEGLSENATLVLNVTTVAALARYLETGMPVINMAITVNGSALNMPKNVLVPVGTAIKDVLEFCDVSEGSPKKILLGGPVMGISALSENETISKQTTAVFAVGKKEADIGEENECIRCARCIEICRANLMPVSIYQSVRYNQVDNLKNLNLHNCIQCGSCSFICPANRHLTQTIKLGKSLLTNEREGS